MIKHFKKVKRGISNVKAAKDDPLGFLINRLIAFFINIFAPIPLIGELIAEYKAQFLFLLLAIILAVLTIFVTLGVMVANAPGNFFPGVATTAINIFKKVFTSSEQQIADELKNYTESGFIDTDIPSRNPLGGNSMENSIITLGYLEPNLMFNNQPHTGIDLVPSSRYYQTNAAYQKTGQIIVFATMNGKATSYVDQYGANVVDIYNSGNTMLTRYVHLAVSFISTGQQVLPGQPVGIMGQTGEATGVHLHYELRVNQGNTFVTVNPMGYIN